VHKDVFWENDKSHIGGVHCISSSCYGEDYHVEFPFFMGTDIPGVDELKIIQRKNCLRENLVLLFLILVCAI
ncbi:hypothetical protein MKW98_001475, partial [Papaver atlanticum]